MPPEASPMSDSSRSHDGVGLWSWILLTSFVLIACFALLGSRGLNEPDEGRYAEVSREMLKSGDWLVPTLHGLVHPQKSPIIYWLIAGSFKVFGHHEWAARLPGALAAVGIAWLTFLTGRYLFGTRVGIAATVVLVTSLEFFALARVLTPDMVLTFWITAAIAAFARWISQPQRSRWIWMFFAAMGIGFLTKGPMGIVVPVSAAVAWQIAGRRRGELVKVPWLRGMALTFVLGLSWFVVVSIKEPRLFHFFAYDELAARFFTRQHGRYHSPLFFIGVVLVGLLPWTFLLGAAVRWLADEFKTRRELAPRWWLIIGWVVPPFLLLSLSGSKLVTYVLPLYPALALAIGAWWHRVGSRRNLTSHAVGVASLMAGLALALIAVLRFFPNATPGIPLPLPGIVGLIALGMGALVVPLKPRPSVVGGGVAAGTLAVWVILSSQAASWNAVMGTGATMRSLAQRILADTHTEPTVFAYGVNVPGLEWYLSRPIYISKDQADRLVPMTDAQQARLVSSPQQCAGLAAPGMPLFGVVKLRQVGSQWPTNTWELAGTAGSFGLIKRKEKVLQ